MATALGRAGIFAWDGHFYATGLIERLGLAESGGVLRLGFVHYNTAAEVDRTPGGARGRHPPGPPDRRVPAPAVAHRRAADAGHLPWSAPGG